MERFHFRFFALLVTLCLAGPIAETFAADSAAEPAYHVVRVMTIGGEGRWDYVTVDSAAKLLYVPRQTHTQIIRADSGEVIGDLAETPGVHGVALAFDKGQGFTSNGKGNTLTCFDLKTLRSITTLAAGKKPDAILYDPASHLVMAFNGGSNNVTAVYAPQQSGTADVRGRILPPLALSGKPEFAVTDGHGHVYVNIEDKNSIAVIDTKAWSVTAEWKIEGGESPTGLAIDTVNHRLFTGCHNDTMAVLDIQTGKTIGHIPIGHGVDGCVFDPTTGEAFASCGDGTLTVAKETSPGKFEVTQTVKTSRGARTMGLDPATHTIYLPTAEYPEGYAGERAAKAGTFMILVVARK